MILHPAIIALVFTSFLISGMILYSSFFGVRIIKLWNLKSGSEEQLILERKTYLISTILLYAFVFQICSLFLYIYTADSLHNLFVGAMCAAGSLHVDPYGYPTFLLKIANCVLAGLWLIINYVDNQAYDYPLIKKKYVLLIFLAPLIVVESVFQLLYFSGMKADVITSCCGSLFGSERITFGSEVTGLSIKGAMALFYGGFLLMSGSGFTYLIMDKRIIKKHFSLENVQKYADTGQAKIEERNPLNRPVFATKQVNAFQKLHTLGYFFSFTSGVFFLISCFSLISFISLYFYEMPAHHCPFCILQKEYGSIGYLLYSTLLTGVVSGLCTGVLIPFQKNKSLSLFVPKFRRRLVIISLISYMIFAVVSIYQILSTDFTMR